MVEMGILLLKLQEIGKSPVFWILVVIVIIVGVAYYANGQINNMIAIQAKTLQEQKTQMDARLVDERKKMETEYNQKIQTYQAAIANIQIEKAKLEIKYKLIEQQLAAVQAKRVEIENKIYTKTDLDIAFHSILVRSSGK